MVCLVEIIIFFFYPPNSNYILDEVSFPEPEIAASLFQKKKEIAASF
jgi:hypothetical protein